MRISKKITFSPSLFVRPSEVFPQLVSYRYYDFSNMPTRNFGDLPKGAIKGHSLHSLLLSVIEEGELDIVQGEWLVKRRNCAATLNNRGSKKSISESGCFFFT